MRFERLRRLFRRRKGVAFVRLRYMIAHPTQHATHLENIAAWSSLEGNERAAKVLRRRADLWREFASRDALEALTDLALDRIEDRIT